MIPWIGWLCLVWAVIVSLGVVGCAIQRTADHGLAQRALMRRTTSALCLTTWSALACLIVAFAQDDFTVRYVAQHSHPTLPWYYKWTAAWGGHAGSWLLWMGLLTSGTRWLARAPLPLDVQPVLRHAMGFLGVLSAAFGLFLLSCSNPFERMLTGLPQGSGLNPLLQHPLFVIHPPLLYTGYVGFAMVGAWVSGMLWCRTHHDASWEVLRRGVQVAFIGLTAGITVGSLWAYAELGWGGWWYWDPVENAALIPWLMSVALLHTVIAARRQQLVLWTWWLSVFGFLSSVLGTFLVRSGVVVSVHAFASDPTRGVYILSWLGIGLVWFGGLYMRAWERHTISATAWGSTEHALSLLSGLASLAAFVVALGTLYPMALEGLTGHKISVGPPYFNRLVLPLGLAMTAAMIWVEPARWGVMRRVMRIGPSMGWGILWITVGKGAGLTWIRAIGFGMGMALGLGLLWTVGKAWYRRRPWCWPHGWGHMGFACLVLGITVGSTWQVERNVLLRPGDTVAVGSHTVTLVDTSRVTRTHHQAVRAQLMVQHRNGKPYALYTERRTDTASGITTTVPALQGGVWQGLYVALGEVRADGRCLMRVQHKPMIDWIWWGGACMAGGGVISWYRRRHCLAA